jgi:hypothetical protein
MSGYRLIGLQLLTTLLVAWIVSNSLKLPLALVGPLLLGGLVAGAFGRSMALALSGTGTTAPRRQRWVQAGFRLLAGVGAIVLFVLVLRATLAALF